MFVCHLCLYSQFRIHIIFSISPPEMKISLILFIFTHTKYIYLRRGINFGEKNCEALLWQLKLKEWKGTSMWTFSYENYIIRILTFCSLKLYLYDSPVYCKENDIFWRIQLIKITGNAFWAEYVCSLSSHFTHW